VNVVQFGEFSKEFCGGTHVANTSEIGFFKFRSEGSIASGTRRIEAVTHDRAKQLLEWREKDLDTLIQQAEISLSEIREMAGKTGSSVITDQLNAFLRSHQAFKTTSSHAAFISMGQLKQAFTSSDKRALAIGTHLDEVSAFKKKVQKELSRTLSVDRTQEVAKLVSGATSVNGSQVVASLIRTETMDDLKSYGDALRVSLKSGAGVLFGVLGDKVGIVCVITDDLVATKKLDAGRIVATVAKLLGGGGGGKAHLATAGAKNVEGIPDAIAKVPGLIKEFLTNT